ncbi:MAG: TIGR02147 family protein [Bdellovibrionota bacterium]
MDKTIFEFKHYKAYLQEKTGGTGTKTGVKTALAKAVGCQSTYLSQVLHAKAHLSLEQAEKLNEFFGHSKEEGLFFFLLLQKDRAGTKSLAGHFEEQMGEILRRRLILTKRLGEKTVLSDQSQSVYYSSWVYAAVHIALTIPELRSREAIAAFLHLPVKKVTEALDFLCSVGLALPQGAHFEVGEAHIRLGNDSHNIIKHHSNWRTQALEALDREQLEDLHYSGVVSLAREDLRKIKEILLDAVKASQAVIKDSKEEELCAIGIDFFSLRK